MSNIGKLIHLTTQKFMSRSAVTLGTTYATPATRIGNTCGPIYKKTKQNKIDFHTPNLALALKKKQSVTFTFVFSDATKVTLVK